MIQEVRVPHAVYGEGKFVYQKRFVLRDSLPQPALRLVAEGINYACTVLLNDRFIAGHTGGYTRFEVALNPGLLRFGEVNVLRIEVDGRLDPVATVPSRHRPLGWEHLTGILREVYLESRPSIAIDDVGLWTEFEEGYRQASITLRLQVHHDVETAGATQSPENLAVFAEIRSLRQPGRTEAVSDRVPFALTGVQTEVEGIRLTIRSPELWTPSTPHRYLLTAYLTSQNRVLDVVQQEIGLREVRIDGPRFLLNGRPFTFHGAAWFDDLLGLPADARDEAILLRIRSLKTLGANLVRVVGFPAHPQFVRACSEQGIFVLEEVPVYCANQRQLRSPGYQAAARQMLTETLQRDKLEPAVLGWGVGTRLDVSGSAAQDWVKMMRDAVRSLDDRPLYLTVPITQPLPAVSGVDFWLVDGFEQPAESLVPPQSTQPVIASVGYLVKPQQVAASFADPHRRRIEAEELQAYQLDQALGRLLDGNTNLAGTIVHALRDWRGPSPLLINGPGVEGRVYPAGLIDLQDKRRISYRMVAAYFTGDRKPPISPNERLPQQPAAFVAVGIGIILVFLFFLNRDKRLRGHLRRVFVHPHGFYMDIRENRKVPAFLTFLLAFLEGAVWGCLIAGLLFAFRDHLLADEILSLLVPAAGLKEAIIWLTWHPLWFIAALTVVFVAIGLLAALLLKTLSFAVGERLPFLQYATLIFWTASCYLVLAAVAPAYHRLVQQPGMLNLLLMVPVLFVLWHLLRFYRGIRVLYLMPALRAAAVLLILIAAALAGAAWYYQHTQGLFDYWPYYSRAIG